MKIISDSLPLVQCCACKKVENNGNWGFLSNELLATFQQNITHSYCDDCFKDLYQKLNLKNHTPKN